MSEKLVRRSCFAVASIAIALAIAACDKSGDTGDEPAVDAPRSESAGAGAESVQSVEAAPARELIIETLPYGEVGDELVYGNFVLPADMVDPLPAVIMIHEWYGLDDHVRRMAERLASEGYIVLAVDLFGGETADNIGAARRLMQGVVEDRERAQDNIRQAYEFLAETADAPQIAALGWSMGGTFVLDVASMYPDGIDAAVVYYGKVSGDENRIARIKAPILGLFAAEDRGIPIDDVRAFEATLERLQKTHSVEVFPGARHAFANPQASGYDAELAGEAWRRTVEFLDATLGSAPASGEGG